MTVFFKNIELIEEELFIDFDKIRKVLEEVICQKGRKIKTLEINLMTDLEILKINKKLLKTNNYTDTISLNLSDDNMIIEGVVFISIERIKDNAREFSKNVTEEFLRVLIHSVLHLCGYQDDTVLNRQLMTKEEDFFLSTISFT